MTTQNEPLANIQARIEELHHTITEREEQIKMRAQKLAADLKDEISPENMIRQHPKKAAGAAFLAGLLLTRALICHRSPSIVIEHTQHSAPSQHLSTQGKTALSTIGFEILRSVKDIGFTFLQRYLEKKVR
ncbi:MAG: hypothetical protein FDX02_06835 [Chlorobium sp.]|nr:MAG: hypothetical protein FDX02_06835 [Chlorobium sp.]